MSRPPGAWQPGSRMGSKSGLADRGGIHIVPSSIKSNGNRQPKPHVVAGFEDDEMSEDEMNLDSIPSFEMPTSPTKFTAFKIDLSPVAETPRLANPEISNYTTRIDDSDIEDTPERDLIDLDDTDSTVSSLYPVSSNRSSTSGYTMSSTAPSSRSSINLATPEPDDQPFFTVDRSFDFTVDPTRTPKASSHFTYVQEPQVIDNWMEYHSVNDPLPPPAPTRAPGSLTLAEIAKRKQSKGGMSALRPTRSNPKRGNDHHTIPPLEPKFDDWQSHAAQPTRRGRGGIAVTTDDPWGSPHSHAYHTTRPTSARFGGW